MFNDIGALELVALVILAVLIFGPDKLPKLIHDFSRFIRRIRDFSENAKADIRSELGPEFKDFEFEDLNPRTFVRKQLAANEDLEEIRNGFDFRKELAEVNDSVHGRQDDRGTHDFADAPNGASPEPNLTKSANGSADGPDLLRKRERPAADERPPFDADAT
ncbi:sec-independent translocase [Streptomyces meridianus]|uniref:Sec-independent protein translocase protein TatB n=1 Tax=Streptomyces meridianus TaxID=2938945 RepID=A0ABT0X129_9ACTN|nr:sec-independent translocase [Streptomyces meridianus]MCM2576194.1 sec-independent translocase [Streptomyces meridianus]